MPRNNGGHEAIQHDAFDPGIDQMFEAWRQTPGGKHVLRHAYRITAPYAARYKRTGRRVSVRLIWETLRDRISWIQAGLANRGIEVKKINGFRLNDHLHSRVARHIVSHRPDWGGLFEFRKISWMERKVRYGKQKTGGIAGKMNLDILAAHGSAPALKPARPYHTGFWPKTCDQCRHQEGRQCLLLGITIKNMDTKRCREWEHRQNEKGEPR